MITYSGDLIFLDSNVFITFCSCRMNQYRSNYIEMQCSLNQIDIGFVATSRKTQ